METKGRESNQLKLKTDLPLCSSKVHKNKIPYRTKFRRTKVPKIWLAAENFVLRKILSAEGIGMVNKMLTTLCGTFDGGYPRNESLSCAFGFGRSLSFLSLGYLNIRDYMKFDNFI